jgi:ABC-2 type transport system permease protein
MKKQTRNIKAKSIKRLAIGLIALLLTNYLSSYYFARIDLTTEKRYTLSSITKSTLKKLNQNIYVTIFLKGKLPSGFKRLQIQTAEMLEEFSAFSRNIYFKIENPLNGKNPKEQKQIINDFSKKGIAATNLKVKTTEGLKQQIIFPSGIITNGEKELAIELLDTQIGVPPEVVLNNSIQSLEFKLIKAIKKLTEKNEQKIAIIKGHGELNFPYLVNIAIDLDKNYQLSEIEIKGKLSSLLRNNSNIIEPLVDVIIIPKPIHPFNEMDKYVIDQYLMYGGNILWLIDPVNANLGNLQNKETSLVFPLNLNIDDQLFTYGVRINTDLIMDLNALPIPLRTGEIGGQAQITFFPWNYYPIIHPLSQHPIVRNLNAIKTEFISSIDTISNQNVCKTILLKSSKKTRLIKTPNTISFNSVLKKMDPQLFNGGEKTIAVLLEGKFKSVYKNRIPPVKASIPNFKNKNKSKPSKMIIISDGDIIKNQLHNSNKKPLPLGYDQFTNQTFGNKEFILNSISYLSGDTDLINLRSREIKLRLLDKTKINNERKFWVLLNTILPILVIIIFSICYFFIRKRKYSHTKSVKL